MGLKAIVKTSSYPALLLTQNNHRFYFTTIPVNDLFPYCFVSSREKDPRKGFQRSLNESRAEDIGRYLSRGNGSIPTNVVLSAQPDAEFEYASKSKTVSFKRGANAFLVLDGQHRLWGYQKSTKAHRVPVAIYEGLSRQEEAKLFIDINTTQRGVPAALLLDIKQLAKMEDDLESTLRGLFDKLNSDSKSCLYGRLSATKSMTGKISRVTFNRSVKPVLKSGIMMNMEVDNQYSLLRNYLNAFDAELEDKSLLVRSAFFEAIFDIFELVISATHTRNKNLKQDSLQPTIQPIAKLDYSAGKGGWAKITKTSISDLMKSALQKSFQVSSDML